MACAQVLELVSAPMDGEVQTVRSTFLVLDLRLSVRHMASVSTMVNASVSMVSLVVIVGLARRCVLVLTERMRTVLAMATAMDSHNVFAILALLDQPVTSLFSATSKKRRQPQSCNFCTIRKI